MKLSLSALVATIALLPTALGNVEPDPEAPEASLDGTFEGEHTDASMNMKRAPQCDLPGQHKRGLRIDTKKNLTLAECLSACRSNSKCLSVQIAKSGTYKGQCNMLSANTANARLNNTNKVWFLYDRDCMAPYECPKCPSSAPLCTMNLDTRQPKCCPAGKPVANNAGCFTPDRVICNNSQIWSPGTKCPCSKK